MVSNVTLFYCAYVRPKNCAILHFEDLKFERKIKQIVIAAVSYSTFAYI
ncbi:hypothetical protein T01_4970 [Trichinella spiralis]|uniref:Uncharacterized protein n=1 Tax=Trichinella spiralis TaxID=6334 RepID=A0A0V1AM64_TRISP|nr:hypothetical protein T01_4970 [Trichinella spiralis]